MSNGLTRKSRLDIAINASATLSRTVTSVDRVMWLLAVIASVPETEPSPTLNPGGSIGLEQQFQVGDYIRTVGSSKILSQSVDISKDGNTTVIGTMTENAYDSSVVVYGWDGVEWTPRLNISGTEHPSHRVGNSVAISDDGSVVVVGLLSQSGSDHKVLVYIAGELNQTILQTVDGTAKKVTVTVSGDGRAIAFGIYGTDIEGKVYYRYGSAYGNSQTLEINGTNDVGNFFGNSVSLTQDGLVLAIGVPYHDNGAVMVAILQSDGTWKKAYDIRGEVPTVADLTGFRVAISANGTRLAISSPTSNSKTGSVRVLENSDPSVRGTTWKQVGQTIVGKTGETSSGFSLALSDDGSRVAVGEPFNANIDIQSGRVRVFELVNGYWVQVGPDFQGRSHSDRFGYDVALSGGGARLAAVSEKNVTDPKAYAAIYDVEALPTSSSSDSTLSVASIIGISVGATAFVGAAVAMTIGRNSDNKAGENPYQPLEPDGI